ncbi:unnamed protein product [Lota lota]
MASANTSLSEENFSCSICLDVFNSPCSISCGHNICTCITTFWVEQVPHKCPVCNELYNTIPDLQVNTLLSEMGAQIKTSVRVKEQPGLEPVDVPCDVCTGTQLNAVKSCLVCLISYCHTHLEPHQRVTGLKRHQLVEPMDRLEDRICKKHDRLLELFCQTEQVTVCQFCTLMDHKSHPVVPLKEEYEVKTAQLGKIEAEVQQMIQERLQKIQDIKDTLDCGKADADREIIDCVRVLTALMCCIQKCRDDLNQTVKEKLKSTEKEAECLIKELEQEIEDLTNRISEVKQLSHTEDHFHFLQAFRSLKNPQHTRDWTTVELCPPSYVGTLRRSLDQLEETLSMEMKKLPDAEMKRVQQNEEAVTLDPDTTQLWLILAEELQQLHDQDVRERLPDMMLSLCFPTNACELTLDPNTAYRRLSLSEDNGKVTWVGEVQSYPDHPERFDSQYQVLCKEGLTGRCYWEVEWKGGDVSIGVTYRGIRRRGKGPDGRLGANNNSWSLYCFPSGYSACYANVRTSIDLRPNESNRVGVYLDRPAGTLSFYRVSPDVGGSSDTLTHIHTFLSTFTQELYPGFRIMWSGSSVSLCEL